jgi:preprotein translocase subunit SecE
MEAENALVSKPKQWMSSTKDFWRDTSSEMKKVTWPARQEVISTTVVVVVTTIVFAVFLWACDQVFGSGIVWLLQKFGAST